MAEAVVSFLLEKLSNLLSSKYTQLEGLERDVQYIMDELESMRGFLRNAEAKQDYGHLDHEQQSWIKQVREAAFDMEDIVDEFLLHFSHGETGFCCDVRQIYTPFKNLPFRNRISSKIRDIKVRVEHIASNHKRYQSTQGISATNTNTSHDEHPIRGHALLLTETDLVGIFEPKREIISFILKDKLHAISVVGMGGLGKTTLVKRIYETPDVKNAFSIHAWVTISQTLRIDVVLKDLIRQIQIPAAELDSMDADGLRALVRDFLKEKRYIIVIDDLWGLDQWDFIKYVFPYDDNCDSCIIITTRNEDVASVCSRQFRGKVYRMRSLSTDDSLSLFCKKTFGEQSCPPHLKSIVNNILTKCGGLPLAIEAIGGLLALKDISQVREWNLVLGSLGSELEGIGKLTPVTKILFLSYNELPYYLKSCLLYTCIFPEDSFIYTEELALLWIAEGFVEVKSGMTTMEVAVSYLNELICRSLIQVDYKALDGRVITCRVHDLVYEMNLSKCKEHNILTTVFSMPYTPSRQKIRRLVLDKVDDFTSLRERVDMVPLLHLRSLIIKGTSSLPILPKAILYPKLLKVLDIRRVSLSSIQIQKIFELSNLIYLNLKNAYVRYIPKSIRKLQNLEYFIPPSPWLKLPIDIIKLKKLRYLMLNNAKAPYGLGELSSLEHLTSVEIGDSKEVIQEIGKLIQLRFLEINGNFTGTNGMKLCTSLEKLTNLQGLQIRSKSRMSITVQPLSVSSTLKYHGTLDLQYSFSSTLQYLGHLLLEGPLVKVPDWVASCLDLSNLWLSKSQLREDQLESLAGLPNLLQLILIDDAYVGNMLHFKAGGFPKLKFIEINNIPSLKRVIFERGTMSDLQTLTIDHCMLLEEMPVGIQYLTKLRTLTFSEMPRLQNELRIKKIDGHLDIAHITEIYIRYYTVDGSTSTLQHERL